MLLKLEEVTISETLPPFTFSLPSGETGKIIADSDKVKDLLLELLLGLAHPLAGKIYLFDKDLASLSSNKLLELRTGCGAVLSGGGLISNLKIRENLTLPLLYHTEDNLEEIEKRLVELLEPTGILANHEGDFFEFFGRPPGALSFYEKRLIALVRAMALDPPLMIYDSVLEGVSKEAAQKILELTLNFHRQKPGRSSLYISVHEDTLEPIKTDWVIRV